MLISGETALALIREVLPVTKVNKDMGINLLPGPRYTDAKNHGQTETWDRTTTGERKKCQCNNE